MLSHEKQLTEKVIGAAIEVHRQLGPGLLESVYQVCLARELAVLGVSFEQEKVLPVSYKGILLETGYRLDFLVEGKVVVELKTVERIEAIHEAQLLTYMRLTGCQVGLIINFNVPVLKNGVKRLVL